MINQEASETEARVLAVVARGANWWNSYSYAIDVAWHIVLSYSQIIICMKVVGVWISYLLDSFLPPLFWLKCP